MIDFFSIELLIGLIIGALLGIGGVIIFKQNRNTDLNNFSHDFKDLKNKLDNIKNDADIHKGSLNQILADVRLSEQQIAEALREAKKTLISGGGQRQGAWGQLILEYILEKKLQIQLIN